MKTLIILFILFFRFNALHAQTGSVVCVHGFFRSSKCMIPLGNTLRNEGLDVYLWDYQSRKRSIEKHAEDLVEVLRAIAMMKPGEPIHFATHSLGGIIVRTAVSHPDCPREAKIGKAILLAPPNKGACLARNFQKWPLVGWVFGKRAGKQLMTFEEKDMAQLGEFPSSMRVLVIAGEKGTAFCAIWIKEPNDGKVTIEETRLPTPHEHKILKVSHHWIMTSRESIAITKQFLLSD